MLGILGLVSHNFGTAVGPHNWLLGLNRCFVVEEQSCIRCHQRELVDRLGMDRKCSWLVAEPWNESRLVLNDLNMHV